MSDECTSKVKAMAQLMAELYYVMTKEIIENYGEDSKEVIKSAIKQFAELRLKRMHEEAKKKGLPSTIETYGIVRDMPGDSWVWDSENPGDVTYCPMQEVWEEYNANDIGYLYCEIDHYLVEGFGAKLNRPQCKAKGDKCCRFIIE